jgi:hypothetical protein
MRQYENKKIWAILVLLIAIAPLGVATADEAENDTSLYRLDFRVTEFKNGDTSSERAYSVLSLSGKSVQIRTGNRVPIFPPDGVEYLSVGLHIDCRIEAQGSRILLFVASEINSFVLPGQASGSGDPPVIRSISSQVDASVVPGELTMISSIDDVMSDSRYQLDVTVTKVD